jgi:hypothetical protein
MDSFDALVGEWHADGQMLDPLLKLSVEASVTRLGKLLVMRTTGKPAAVPDTLAIIGGAPDGAPQPMYYFDSRGVKRLFLMALDRSTWQIWRAPGEDWNGPDGPGFNQRFIGKVSTDGNRIDGRWERGLGVAGDQWELDFTLNYVRKRVPAS